MLDALTHTILEAGTQLASTTDAGRVRLDLSSGWGFFRGRASRRWLSGTEGPDHETVSLPHSWNLTDTFQTDVEYYQGFGAYRRSFVCPPDFSRGQVWLCSDGFYGTGKVWMNNRLAGRVNGQFLGFRLPVGPLLRDGPENRIACCLTNRCGNRELPGIRHPDFLLHGGLAGRIWLEKTADGYLDDAATQVKAVAGESPHVEASVCVVNAGKDPVKATIAWSLKTIGGRTLTEVKGVPQSVAGGSRETLAVLLPAPEVLPWSDKTPHLYDWQATLLVDGRPADGSARRIGFRTAEFRPGEGFFLNGERLMLAGCNRHESMPGCGNALSVAQHRADAEAIRDMGLNFVRLSHYPQSPAFLDACDELGLLVYAELASWKSVRGGTWLRKALRQFEGMIRRDSHHPSVILWGMGNEGRHRRAFIKLRALARQLDDTRPVTYAENHLYRARRKHTVGLPDVWGCNYELDALEAGRDASKLGCVVVSECSNSPDARRGDLEAERQQVDQLAADLPRIEQVPFVAGFAIWCLCDYATLRKSRYLRYSGIVDAWREPKLAAFWLRARYRREAFIKLAADWQSGPDTPGDLRRVDLFMNVEKAQISINDRPVDVVRGSGHHVLQLPFEPGRLSAVAVHPEGVGDVIESFGPAVQLTLRPQPDVPATLRVEVLDKAGHLVRNWHGDADLAVSGSARAFPYREGKVLVAAGTARIPVAMESASPAGEWKISAGNLRPATLNVLGQPSASVSTFS